MSHQSEQVAEVYSKRAGASGRFGSGYLVGPTLVLTAWHALSARGDGDRCEVRLLGSTTWRAATVAWHSTDADLALLRMARRQGLTAIAQLGAIPATGLPVFHSVGFPAATALASGIGMRKGPARPIRDTLALHGTIGIGSYSKTRFVGLDIDAGGVPQTSRDWEGYSGAAVFSDGILVAVVLEHDESLGSHHLRAAPASLLLDGDVCEALLRRDGITDAGAAPAKAAAGLRPAAQLSARWSGRARGVDVPTRRGDYFSGRSAVFGAIARWLAQPAARRPLLVTGRPGSGKSAVLGRLVEHHDDFHIAAVDIAVDAGALQIGEVVRGVAAGIDVDTDDPTALVQAVAERQQPLVVVIDSLDEVGTPGTATWGAVARTVIRPLARDGGARVIVGSRRTGMDVRDSIVEALGVDASDVVDLDDPAYADSAAIEEYIYRCLRTEDPDSPYHGRTDLARMVARAVAARAGISFLVAAITGHWLADRGTRVDIDIAGWDAFPSDVDAAVEDMLDRFGDERQRAEGLLRAVAYGLGSGLPRDTVWPLVAQALAARAYTLEDVAWLRRSAAAFLVEDSSQRGEPRVRLFHQSLVEYLAEPALTTARQSQIVDALLAMIPVAGEGRRAWSAASDYIRRHLADHAALAGRLADLFEDAGFVAVAAGFGLVRHLGEPDIGSLPAAQALGIVAHALNGHMASDAAQLELAAVQSGLNGLGAQFRLACSGQPFSAVWGHASGHSRHIVIGSHDAGIEDVVTAQSSAGPVVATVTNSGVVRIWDPVANLQTREPYSDRHDAPGRGRVHYALASQDSHVLLASVDNQSVSVIDVIDGSAVLHVANPIGPATFSGTAADPHAIAVAFGNGPSLVCVVADEHGVATYETGLPPGAADATVVAVGFVDGKPMTVAGCYDGSVIVWRLDGVPHKVPPPLSGSEGVRAIRVRSGFVESAEIVAGHYSGIVTVRNAASPDEPLITWDLPDLPGCVGIVDGDLVAGMLEGSVFVRGRKADATVDLLQGHDDTVTGIAALTILGHTSLVTASMDQTVRLWLQRSGGPTSHRLGTRHLESLVAKLDGRGRLVTLSRGRAAAVWDARTGRQAAEWACDLTRNWLALDIVEGNIVFGEILGHNIHWLRLDDDGVAVAVVPMHAWEEPGALGATSVDGELTLLVGDANVPKLFDAHSGEFITGNYHLGISDKFSGHVVSGRSSIGEVAVFMTFDGQYAILRLPSLETVGVGMGRRGALPQAAVVAPDSSLVVVSAAYSSTVRVVDMAASAPAEWSFQHDAGRVVGMSAGRLHGRDVIVTGTPRGSVTIYALGRGDAKRWLDIATPGFVLGTAVLDDGIVVANAWGLCRIRIDPATAPVTQ